MRYTLRKVVLSLKTDDFKQYIAIQWKFLVNRHREPFSLDGVLTAMITDGENPPADQRGNRNSAKEEWKQLKIMEMYKFHHLWLLQIL